jgi:hypothetical protein
MSGSLPVFQPQPAPNPFAQAGQTISSVNALRDYQAKQATANAYQQSIDPQTGAFDQGKFNALIGSTPQGAWNAGQTMQQAGQAMTATGQGQTAQIQAKQAQLNGIGQYMTPLMQKVQQGQPVSGADVLSATQNAVDAGFVTPEMAANIKNQVASLGPNGDASNLVRGAYFGTQAGLEQLKALSPNYQTVQQGSQVGVININPNAPGSVQAGTALPMGLTPGEAWGNRVTTYDAKGNPISVPLGYTVPPSAGGVSSSGAPTSSLPSSSRDDFVKSFTPLAQNISQRTGLPVNYIIGQAGLETGWGTSGASGNNNFFGISPGGKLASYRTPQEGADAYVNLVNNEPRYAGLDRTGTPQEIGDRFAQAGYNPAVPGSGSGPSYGTRIGNFAAGLTGDAAGGVVRPYQVASTGATPPPPGSAARAGRQRLC